MGPHGGGEERLPARAFDTDCHWAGECAGAEGEKPHGCGGGVSLRPGAAVCAAGACGGGSTAVAVFARGVHRRHVASTGGLGGSGGGGLVGRGGEPVEEPLGWGIPSVAPGIAGQGSVGISVGR